MPLLLLTHPPIVPGWVCTVVAAKALATTVAEAEATTTVAEAEAEATTVAEAEAEVTTTVAEAEAEAEATTTIAEAEAETETTTTVTVAAAAAKAEARTTEQKLFLSKLTTTDKVPLKNAKSKISKLKTGSKVWSSRSHLSFPPSFSFVQGSGSN